MQQRRRVIAYLKNFILEGNEGNDSPFSKGVVETAEVNGIKIPRYVNEFWTSRQRQSASIHEISYRACFKAQLPAFFIKLLTAPGDFVFDPFSGRGTTIIEAAILNRKVISNDVNPLSKIISYPRLSIPEIDEVYGRLAMIPIDRSLKAEQDLSMFYHPVTEAEIVSIKGYLERRKEKGTEDDADRWIRMVATNRLTGHSPGFFSIYTLPPNQAVSPERQVKINVRRNQKPEYRDTREIIRRKSRSLLRNLPPAVVSSLRMSAKSARFLEWDARNIGCINDRSVDLTVTSPPFLDVVQYSKDNWLRCWFNGIDTQEIEKKITMSPTVEEWASVMGQVLKELFRVTKPGGWVAFEVGEVRGGKINLEEYIIPLGLRVGFACPGVLVNRQKFTKTSNIWGIKNNCLGTNTNRIVLFNKEDP